MRVDLQQSKSMYRRQYELLKSMYRRQYELLKSKGDNILAAPSRVDKAEAKFLPGLSTYNVLEKDHDSSCFNFIFSELINI